MTLDIGIDFTSNHLPPRQVTFTDWEARLIEHCLMRYLDAAVEIDDVTVPLATSALSKVRSGQLDDDTEAAQADRWWETRDVLYPRESRELRGFAHELAEALDLVAPTVLQGIRLGRTDAGMPAPEWLRIRRERAAAKTMTELRRRLA